MEPRRRGRALPKSSAVYPRMLGLRRWAGYPHAEGAARQPGHLGQLGHHAGASSINGPALLLAGRIQQQQWPLDAVPTTSPGL